MKRTKDPVKKDTTSQVEPQTRKCIGYLRVSTASQDTDKNQADILAYANTHNFGQVTFLSETVSGATSWKNRELNSLVESLNQDDILIVPELSRLGRSLVNVLELLNTLSLKRVKVYSVKENFQLNGDDLTSKVMRTMFGLFAEIERDLIRARTIEGLAAAREKGHIGGRRPGIRPSKLDPHKEEIVSMLKRGITQKYIAEHFKISQPGLHFWLNRHGLTDIKPEH
jgi:DNA invertase Pin-like site-specific DNA recombinase